MGPAVRSGMLTAALLVATSSAAWGAPSTSDPTEIEAQTRFEEGLKRVKVGDFGAARVSFTQAYAVLHRPRILWNLALCEEKIGHLVDALGHFKQVARDTDAIESDRADAQTHVDGLMSKTGHVDVQAPPGVTLTVDGELMTAMTPLAEPLDVPAGRHVIDAKLSQGVQSMVVDAPAGEVAHVSFHASDVTDLPPPGPAAPVVNPPVVDANSATMPASPAESPPSAHSGARVATVVVLGGAAIAAVAFGAYFGLQSQNDASTAATFRAKNTRSTCVDPMGTLVGTCAQWNDAVSSQNREATASTALYVAGGVLAAGAIITWFAWPKRTERSAWVAPAIGPGSAAISAGGAF